MEYWVNRYILIEKENLKCAICGTNENLEAHHIDGNKNNNELENLMILCRRHHRGEKIGIHSQKGPMATVSGIQAPYSTGFDGMYFV